MDSINDHAPIRVLGVDPGTKLIGYAVVSVSSPGCFEYLECGVLRPKAADVDDRIFEVAGELTSIIKEFRADEFAIESAFHGINAYSALRLGEARGAYKLIAAQAGLQVFEYAPSKVKRAITGRGRATKIEIQRRVSVLCALRVPPPADAADALAIALCHAQLRSAEILQTARLR